MKTLDKDEVQQANELVEKLCVTEETDLMALVSDSPTRSIGVFLLLDLIHCIHQLVWMPRLVA